MEKNGIERNKIYSRALFWIIIILCLLIFVKGSMAEDSFQNEDTTIRIAIFRMSPEVGNFSANHATIEHAINISSKNEADWFITPEMSESGYEFSDYIRPDQLPEFPSPWFSRLENISREKNITLFIGFPERSEGEYYNSVAVIDKEGGLSGVFHKIDIIPGIHEGWATPGNITLQEVDNQTIGYYICADAVNPNITNTYFSSNVDIMLSSAAWYPDPTMGPDEYWKNITMLSDSPLVIANTIGKNGNIDFNHAKSGVYQGGKEAYIIPGSDQVIAFIDWNYLTGEILTVGDPERV